MRYLNTVVKGSPHDVLVGLGLEAADHSGAAGTKCTSLLIGPDYIETDDAVVFEQGQPAGTFAAGTLDKLGRGLWAADANVQRLADYLTNAQIDAYLGLAAGAATQAQTQAALSATIRTLRSDIRALREYASGKEARAVKPKRGTLGHFAQARANEKANAAATKKATKTPPVKKGIEIAGVHVPQPKKPARAKKAKKKGRAKR